MTTSKPCNQKENVDLFRRISQGDKTAARRFIEGNMACVVSMVDRFLDTNEEFRFLQDDLISEGYLTLVRISKKITDVDFDRFNPQGMIFVALRNALVRMTQKERQSLTTEPLHNNLLDADREKHNKKLRHDILACCKSSGEGEIIQLHLMKRTDAEIAELLNLSRSQVFRRRHRIFKRIKKILSNSRYASARY